MTHQPNNVSAAGALDVSVLARLSVQIFDCPLNPTISKFARAVEAHIRAAASAQPSPACASDAGAVLHSAYNLCPDHVQGQPARMRWMADYFLRHYAAASAQATGQATSEPVAWVLPDMVGGEYSGITLTRSKPVAMRHGGKPLYYAAPSPAAREAGAAGSA